MSTIARLAALTRARVNRQGSEEEENNEGVRSIRSFAFLSQLLSFNRNRDGSADASDQPDDEMNQEDANSEQV